METLIKRQDKGVFYKPEGSEGVYYRLRGFSELNFSENPIEYKRSYVDEEYERVDVTGYSPNMEYCFDRFLNNPVHDDIVRISEGRKILRTSQREIIIADMTGEEKEKSAVSALWTVIPETSRKESTMSYRGRFCRYGSEISGTITSDDCWQSCVFIPESKGAEET